MRTLKVGKTWRLTPRWSSANDAIATVSSTGVVTAVAPGTTEVYCSIGYEVAAAVYVIKVEALK